MDSHKNIVFLLLCFGICTISSMSMAQLQPPPLQDFCVADLNSTLLLGGSRPCKDPKNVKDDDFFFHGFGSVDTIPGLNTLGIRVTPLTLGPGDLNPPHYHPRAAELVYVVKGSVEAGFVTSGPEFRLFKKILKEGDVFVVPFGLVHFQTNIGKDNSTAELLVFFNSDKPGVVTMSSVLFGSVPLLPVDLLAKSLQVDESVIKEFQNAAN